MFPEDVVGEGVERSSRDFFAAVIEEDRRATEHFLGGSPCERQKEDVFRFDAQFDEICDPVDDRPCFSCAGPGNDEMGTVDRGDGFILACVQFVLIVDAEILRMNDVKLVSRLFDGVFFQV